MTLIDGLSLLTSFPVPVIVSVFPSSETTRVLADRIFPTLLAGEP